MKPIITVYFDTRREKENHVYPVKLRIYFNKETRYYPTGIDLTKQDYQRAFLSEKPRKEYRDVITKLAAQQTKAHHVLNEIKGFTFEKFEKKFLTPLGSGSSIMFQYDQVIKVFKAEDRIKTAGNYEQSKKSIKTFLESKGLKPEKIHFEHFTIQLLKEYERWMLAEGKKNTTIGIYLRPLRALFNIAIADGEITSEVYPFGKRKYQIPAGRNIKKALSKEGLKKMFDYQIPEILPMYKARSFWFFSYVCNGINIRDIAELKYKNIGNDSISFIRNKTKNTTKSDLKPIIAPLTAYAREVIEKYGNPKVNGETYVFPVLKQGINETEKIRLVQLFTRFINQHIKKLAEAVGVDTDISTYWARHTFTTISIHNGATLEFIQDSLGHNNIATTMNYWKGFDDNVKKENADKLMEF